MSLEVRPAAPGDLSGICDLLYDHMSRKIDKGQWRRILDYPWRCADRDHGRVAVDGSRVVGFMGQVYSDRTIGDRTERVGNLCAWYLMQEYRGRGLGEALLRESVADPGITYTNLTATLAAAQAFRKAGFEVLDADRFLLRRRAPADPAVDLRRIESDDAADRLLSRPEHRLWSDHRSCDLTHLVLRADGESCYLVLSVKKKGPDLLYHEVMHASNLPLLDAHAKRLADALLVSDDQVLAIDRRFLPRIPEGAVVEPIRLARLYRSPDLPRKDIDHLYSEVVLLSLKMP
jgi:GNAT superfamily N-acetyltransferase